MRNNSVAIILVNFNGEKLTIDCIDSINRGTIVPDVILVDNASRNFDKSLFEIYENVTVIENKDNLGFAGGNNIAIKHALNCGYKYIGLLNNDTVIDTVMVEELLKKIDKKTLTIPKMYYYFKNNVIWYAGGYFNFFKGEAFHVGLDEVDVGQFNSEQEVTFATGCCWLTERTVFERLGGLAEEYFMYCEDTDFCLRCKNAGIRLLYVPTAKLWHKVGSTAGKDSINSVYYRNRNRFYVINKFHLGLLPYAYTLISRIIKYCCSFILNNNNYAIKQAYLDYKNEKMYKQDVKRRCR